MLIIALLIISLIISQFNPWASAVLDLAVALALLSFLILFGAVGPFYWASMVIFFFNSVLFFCTKKPVAHYFR
jgi:uncharacterized membrane protein